MAKTRPDENITIVFRKENAEWTTFTVIFEEKLDDLTTDPMVKGREETYNIEDLTTQIKTDLLAAYNGMVAHRNTIDPIT